MHYIIVDFKIDDFRLTHDCSLQATTGSAYELTARMTTICRRDDFHHLKFIIRSRLSRKIEKDDRQHSYCVDPTLVICAVSKKLYIYPKAPFF